MTPARLWRLLPLIAVLAVMARLWLGAPSQPGALVPGLSGSADTWAERLPGPPTATTQQPWLAAVSASPAWGGSPEQAAASVAATTVQEVEAPAPATAWTFLGTYFDGFIRRALVLYHEEGARVLELKAGDRLPSGERIEMILEDELRLQPPQEAAPLMQLRVGRSNENLL